MSVGSGLTVRNVLFRGGRHLVGGAVYALAPLVSTACQMYAQWPPSRTGGAYDFGCISKPPEPAGALELDSCGFELLRRYLKHCGEDAGPRMLIHAIRPGF